MLFLTSTLHALFVLWRSRSSSKHIIIWHWRSLPKRVHVLIVVWRRAWRRDVNILCPHPFSSDVVILYLRELSVWRQYIRRTQRGRDVTDTITDSQVKQKNTNLGCFFKKKTLYSRKWNLMRAEPWRYWRYFVMIRKDVTNIKLLKKVANVASSCVTKTVCTHQILMNFKVDIARNSFWECILRNLTLKLNDASSTWICILDCQQFVWKGNFYRTVDVFNLMTSICHISVCPKFEIFFLDEDFLSLVNCRRYCQQQ